MTKKKQKQKSNSGDVILITGGDPAGIGPELVESILPDIALSLHPVLYFSTSDGVSLKRFLKKAKKGKIPFATVSADEYDALFRTGDIVSLLKKSGRVAVDLSSLDSFGDWSCAKPGRGSGLLAFLALRYACDYIIHHGARGLCTAPLSKEWVAEGIGKKFPGHTDYLSERFNTDVLMLMHGKSFSVIPLTVHIPLSEVSSSLQKTVASASLQKLLLEISTLKVFRKKKLALCGVNPHSGEGGHIGTDEMKYLETAAEKWRSSGIPVEGPLSSDGIFMPENIKNYRLVLSAYHDQGLIPFKALEGKRGINVSLGLPFLRTSPDHGTAFGIAGKNKADPKSMRNAFRAILKGDLIP